MSDTRTQDHAALLKRSLLAIDRLEAKLAAVERARSEPIAIIGVGCRFAGAVRDSQSFWELLAAGTDVMSEVPAERWDADRFYDPNPEAVGKTYTKRGYFVRGGVDQFDAPFFGISRREAQSLDPQQRLLLEVVWEALEDAGIAPASLMGSQTAVYTGISTLDYFVHLTSGDRALTAADAYTASGTAHSVASGRISYALGLQGPNVAVDTACSSSLVAVHLAVQSLRSKEASLALAGGVNLMLVPDAFILVSRARMLAPDGRCKAFDAAADGYARAEGCGVLVLKRLSDAQRDGDRVLAVIRGTALNQDGRTSGVTAPNGPAQEAVIRLALANAGLAPADISYVEAHGTGTSLGDPIEIKALGEVFGAHRAEQPLLVGSVKTNLGHTEAAAGVAGVIKAVLALRHRAIPPHLHLRTPNPLIAWDRHPIVVPTELTPWNSPEGMPRRAGISSFGFSGTNAHVVIEEAPESALTTPVAALGPQLLGLSAEKPEALRQLAERFQAYLATADAPALADIARSAIVGRSHFTERVAVVASSARDAAEKLAGFAQGSVVPGVAHGRTSGGTIPEIAFLFTGQGSQFAGMGQQLFETQPVFRAALEQCGRILDPVLGSVLLDVVFGTRPGLDDTRFTQPALFALEYSLAQLWKAWGVEPSVVMGHSVGEYVAACIAGVFSLEDGLKLIAERGRLMGTLASRGAMAAVFTDEARVRAALGTASTQLTIAGTNGPQNTVISGSVEAVEAVRSRLAAQGVESQRLNVSHAFHSHLMDPMLDAFESFAAKVSFSPPGVGIVSNVTGKMAGDEIATAAYWRRHIRHAVRFSESVATLQAEGLRVCLEVGPHPTLLGMVQRCANAGDLSLIPSLRRGRDDTLCMLEGMGQLYVRGVPVVAAGIWGAVAGHHRVPLPGYPFQRERYWRDVDARASGAALNETRTAHPLLGGALPSAVPVFQQQLGADHPAWVADHRIGEYILFPATGFLELAVAAGIEVLGTQNCLVRDLRISAAMILPESGSLTVQVAVTPADDGTHQVQIFSCPGGANAAPWQSHATAIVARSDVPAAALEGLGRVRQRNATPVDLPAYYEQLDRQGLHYGPAFRGLEELQSGSRESLGRVALPGSVAAGASQFVLHPALLVVCLQTIGAALTEVEGKHRKETFLPVGVESYRVWQPGVSSVRCHTIVHPASPDTDSLRFDLHLFDDDGEGVAEVRGLELRHVARSTLARAAAGNDPDWAFEVSWQALSQSAPPHHGSGRWLVLGDANGLGRTLASRLAAEGASVRHVLRGPTYSIDGPAWQLDPANPDQVREMLAEATRDSALSGVIALWPLEQPPFTPGTTVLETAHREAIAPLLALAQAMADSTARLWLLTRGAQSVSGSVPDLVQAPAWGLGGVIASELAASRVVRIDLDPQTRTDEADLLLQVIRPDDAEDRMALRGNSALMARLNRASIGPSRAAEPVRLASPKRVTQPHSDASYLVTGGLGGLGLTGARLLAAEGAKHLILIGRRPPSAEARQTLEDLGATGVRIRVEQGDVADFDQMRAVIERARTSMPPLRGILHAAGITDDAMLGAQTLERFREVMKAKVQGAWHLHALTADLALDFFVAFSSSAALVGSAGQGNYVAANAFLDALCRFRQARGLPGISIQWGVWSGVGMGATVDESHQRRWAAMGVSPIAPEAGMKMLSQLLHGYDGAEVAAIPIIRGRLPANLGPFFSNIRTESAKPAATSAADILRRLATMPRAEKSKELLRFLSGQIVSVLALSASFKVDPERSLLDLGLDSLMAMDLRNRLQSSLGVTVPVDELLKGKSLVQLSERVLSALPAQSARLQSHAGAAEMDQAPGEDSLSIEREEFSL